VSEPRVPKTLFFAILAAGILQCLHDLPLLRVAWLRTFPRRPRQRLHDEATIPHDLRRRDSTGRGTRILDAAQDRRDSRQSSQAAESRILACPERRAETFAYFQKFFAWYGCAFLLLEVFAMGLAMRANFQSPPQLPTGRSYLRLPPSYFFNIVWVAAMIRRFSKLPQG